MFSVREKREISERIQAILQETDHPELPSEGEIVFRLQVNGATDLSWAVIWNNESITNPSVNPHNEKQDPQTVTEGLGVLQKEENKEYLLPPINEVITLVAPDGEKQKGSFDSIKVDGELFQITFRAL